MAYYVPSITTMGVLTGVPALRHVVPGPRYAARVRVYRAGEWIDITSRVASGVIRESNDQPVATLELRLLNGREYPSLAPRRKDSPLNQVNGQYVPLLWIGRLIAVEAAFSEDGSEPDEWWPVFLGELEDEIDTESGPDGTYVRLFCRDLAARLQRDYIAGPLTYENMMATDMIQKILDDRYSAGALPEPVTLTVIGDDDFFVERYEIEYMDTWSALQRFCQQRGTDLRYRLNEATGQIELTYWLPDRAMAPGWIIDASQTKLKREELRISGTDIINRVTVRYRDAATGQRAEVTVQDEDSIAMYGLRHGLIEEPDTDLIPDEATAQTLAQTIVEDLKDVPALTRITCPFDPRIQLFDKLRVANPSVRDEPEDYAVEERELSFTATDWSMTLVAGGRVVVKRHTWLERLAKEGIKKPFTPRDTTTAREPGAPSGLTGQFVGTNAVFSWDESLDPYHRWFAVEVRVGGQVKRRDYVEATSYTYTLDMNRHDNGTPSPQVELRVYSKYTTGALSAPAIVAVSHPAPPQPTLSLRSSSAQIRWAVTSPTPPAWEATTVQVGTYSETVAAMSGTVDAVEAGIADGNIATVTIKLRDVFGQEGQPATGQVTVNYLDKAAFAANIRPVELVSTLPQLPNPQYPQGSVVFLTTDNKLYRSTGTAWTAAVPTTDLSGTITETHIANDAVTTPKLKADAVTTDKLAAGAVTADKLAANSVTAGKIAAGAVKADAIDVDELSAISADLGTVTAGIVQTPDGRAKFGEAALGSGKHGMLVSDGTQDRVAVGDLSGRIWQGQPLPPGTYGLWSNNVFIEGLQLDPSIEDIDGAHDFDRVGGVAAGGSVHIGPAGITVTDGKIEITSTDGRTKFLGDRWEVYDDNGVLRVRIGRL